MRLMLSFFLVILLSGSGLFAVHAQQANTSAAVKQQAEVPPVEVYAVDNRIKVSNAPIGSKLEIYSVVGIKVVEIELKQASGEYTVNIAKGYYIIRIGNTVRKVAIR